MLDKIKSYCEGDATREQCGVVIQNKQTNTVGVVPVPNIIDGAGAIAEFTMDPVTWFRIQKELRRGVSDDYEVIARFHSHPRWVARPSAYDISAATYPQVEIIYSPHFNTFCAYAPRAHAEDVFPKKDIYTQNAGTRADGGEPIRLAHVEGTNDRDSIVKVPLIEYTHDLFGDYATDSTYEDFDHWRRWNR